MRIFKIGRLALAAAAVLFLAGCVTTAAKRGDAGLELDLAAKGNEGFVLLKVVSTRPISLLNPKWQSIRISSDGRNEELTDITPPYTMLLGQHVPTESLYFARLPAGKYQITGMGSFGPGPGLLLALMASDQSSAGKQLPGFSIEAGRLANLGTVVYAPEMDKEQPERMALLNGPQGKQAGRDALLAETSRPQLPLAEGGGWATTATAEAEAAVLAQVRQLVSMLSISKTGGGLMAGSHLGQIFRRTGPQTWAAESLDNLETVYSLAQTGDGRLIAGSGHGRYYVKNGNGSWQGYRLASETGRVAHIEPRSDGSVIFIIGESASSKVWLKKSLQGAAEPPAEIATVPAPPDNLLINGKEIVMASNIPGISRQSVITRIDKQSLAVSSQNENFWVIGWQFLPDGQVILTRQNGMSYYRSWSDDNMKTWKTADEPGMASTVWIDRQRAVGLDWRTGMVMLTNLLQKTTDGGKTWETIGTPLETKHYAGRLVYADDGEILLQGSHMLYSTTDQGRTWRRLFPPQPKS